MRHTKIILLTFLMLPLLLTAQEEEKKKETLERDAYASTSLFDNPTNVLLKKNTLEIQMQHRFGLLNGNNNDLAGFWAPSNIRIGVAYGIHERLTIGFATVKFDRLQDFNWKLSLLRQTKSGNMPFSVTYYGNYVVNATKSDQLALLNNRYMIQDRYSFFNQLIIAKRFNSKLSMQLAPSISHFNVVDKAMENDVIALSFGGRYKISSQTSVLLDFTKPITEVNSNFKAEPGISVGVEFATSAHEFQLMLSNYNGLTQQKNIMYNSHDFFNSDFLIGFNITRRYNF